MKHGQPRRNQQHPGVRVLRLTSGAWAARWNDPVDGALRQQNLDKLGLSNATKRRRWAIAKSKAITATRASVLAGDVAPTKTKVVTAVADYLETMTNKGTKVDKAVPLHAFSEWCAKLGCHDLTDLTGLRLVAWRDYVLSSKHDHMMSTRNKYMTTTAIFLRWAHDRGLTTVPWDKIRSGLKRAPEPDEAIQFLRPPELRQLLLASLKFDAEKRAAWRIAPVVMTLLLSGCRFAEVAFLKWVEVDFGAGEIRLAAGRTKTAKARTVSLKESPTLLDLLRVLHEKAGDAERVFPGLRHPTWESSHLIMIAKCGAPQFSAHALRRSCGTLLTNAPGIYGGASAWHSAKRLGHSVQQAEAHYAGQLTNLPPTAATIEDAAGIRDLCHLITEAVKAD